jgi:hypothetical protein
MSELDPQTDTLDETLVAYLEGELDAESAQQVEHRLANEDKVRKRLQSLAQSWDLLDHLPRAAADETFARTTVEMVAVAAERELVERSAAQVARKSRRYLAGAAAVAAAAAIGFVAIALGWANPNDKLLRDLPTIENVELYRQVGDIDFLRRLGDENLFSDEAAEVVRDESTPAADKTSAKPAKAAVAVTPASFDARRDFVRALDPAEKEVLNQKLDKFLSLPADEQVRLRKLDAELAADPHADRLRHVMERYYDWLKTLSAAERADLLALGSVDRVAMIKSLTHEQEARLTTLAGGFHLMRSDVDTLHRWIDDMALKHKDELLKDMPEKRQQEIKSLDERQLKQRLALMAWQRLRSNPGGPGPGFTGQGPKGNTKPLDISPAEAQHLIDQLSTGARGVLAEQATPEQREQTIRSWVQAFARVRFGSGRFGQMISQDDLDRIFKNLPQTEQDRLAALPHDELNRELRRRYFEEQFKNGPKDRPGRKGDRHDEHRDDRPPLDTQKTSA